MFDFKNDGMAVSEGAPEVSMFLGKSRTAMGIATKMPRADRSNDSSNGEAVYIR